MKSLIIRHKVKDFSSWKKGYDDHAGARAAAGLGKGRVTRSVEDPNEVILIFEVGDMAKAKAFGASDDLKAAMRTAGVIDKPDSYFVEDAN